MDNDRKHFEHYLLHAILVIVMTGIMGCNTFSGQQRPHSERLPIPTPSPIILAIDEIPQEGAMAYFQDAGHQQDFELVESLTQSGWQSLHTFSKFYALGILDEPLSAGPYAVIKPGQDFTGYILYKSTLDDPHDYGLLTTLDYRPIQVRYNNTITTMPIINFEPGIWYAYQFTLPPLPEGLHTLIITSIVEPEMNFLKIDGPEGISLFESASMGLRDMPSEFGVLIWVTPDQPKSVLDWPEESRLFEPQETSFITSIQLYKEVVGPEESQTILYKDTAEAGDEIPYALRFSASETAKNVPVYMLVVWDDLLTQRDLIEFPGSVTGDDAYAEFTVQVPDDLPEGSHTLTVVAYPYPYYLRSWDDEDGSLWRANAGYYSLLAARLPVKVERP